MFGSVLVHMMQLDCDEGLNEHSIDSIPGSVQFPKRSAVPTFHINILHLAGALAALVPHPIVSGYTGLA